MPRKGQNIYKRKDGRWEGRYIRSHDANGKAKYGYIYAKTYSEVKQLLSLARANSYTCRSNTSDICYNDVLDDWLKSTKPSVKESTYAQYTKLINNHIRPYLGSIQMREIQVSKIENHIIYLLNNGRKDGGGGLSHKTVSDVYSIIKSSIKYSNSLGYSSNCEVNGISIRKKTKEMRVLSIDEQKRLMYVLCSGTDRYKFGVLLSLYTGLRIGELCALKWSNINLENAVLSVTETLQRIQTNCVESVKTKVIVTPPKSEKSIREIPIPARIITIARDFQSAPESYVLSGSSNSFVEPRVMQYKFKSYIKEAGIDDTNFHALRHTFATRCIECGFETKSLSEILGHSSVSITLNRYAHSSMELKRQNMNKLNSLCIFSPSK